MGQAISDYIRFVGMSEPDILRRLREETARHPQARMQITSEQGQFFRVLLGAIGAAKCLEVGVFTGYSSIVTAMALPEHGRLIACDMSEEYTSIARRYWREAGVEHRIELRLGPAVDTLRALLDEGSAGTFDFAFIDAEKTEYDAYYELALHLLRPGGLMAIDNMLWHGQVLDEDNNEPGVMAIKALNLKIKRDSRVTAVLLPIADGVTLARKL
ncbi:MAG: class I SAM-dependent methyltransferase [Bryobacteraceae bacterium]